MLSKIFLAERHYLLDLRSMLNILNKKDRGSVNPAIAGCMSLKTFSFLRLFWILTSYTVLISVTSFAFSNRY